MASCLRKLLPADLCENFQKMSHLVQYNHVTEYPSKCCDTSK